MKRIGILDLISLSYCSHPQSKYVNEVICRIQRCLEEIGEYLIACDQIKCNRMQYRRYIDGIARIIYDMIGTYYSDLYRKFNPILRRLKPCNTDKETKKYHHSEYKELKNITLRSIRKTGCEVLLIICCNKYCIGQDIVQVIRDKHRIRSYEICSYNRDRVILYHIK